MAPTRKVLTLKEKIEVIECYEKDKLSYRALGKKFLIGRTQACEIINKKTELKERWESGSNRNEKRVFKNCSGARVDALCFEWFCKARSKGIPLSGPFLQSKAKEIAESIGLNDFRASGGWLEKFRIRHSISFKAISGEAASVNPEDVSDFVLRIPHITKDYNPSDIYNIDETGLFFRALPTKTLSLKGEKCTGGKMAKERLTVLHCANMVGDKEKLLVIGKSARPRSFAKVDRNSLPVSWYFNKKAWMTAQIMVDWLKQFDRKMSAQKRKVLLFLDNAASHPKNLKFNNVKIVFLPPNTTAEIQPMDQGIIRSFKTNYRLLIIKHVLSKMDESCCASDLAKSITVFDALYFIEKAWRNVTSTTIQNCFRKAGFMHHDTGRKTDDLDFDPEDEIPLCDLRDILRSTQYNAISCYDLNDFISVDENLLLEDTSFDISLPTVQCDVESDSEEENDLETEDSTTPIKSYKEALECTKHLKNFTKQINDVMAFELIRNFEEHVETCVLKTSRRQTKISEFFYKNV